jgi:glycosyltransferase involved in cell wall biosynthesis
MKKPYKILTFTPAWQRAEILEICLTGLKRLKEYNPEKFEITPFFIVSEKQTEEQVKRFGFNTFFYKNQPLGEKKNAGLNYALKNFTFDYVMELGSDDLIANEYLDFVEPYLEQKIPLFNVSTVYFIDAHDGHTAKWTTEVVLGLGRIMTREAIDSVRSVKFIFNEPAAGPDVSYTTKRVYLLPIRSALHYEKIGGGKIMNHNIEIYLWSNTGVRGMDTFSMKTLERNGIQNTIIPCDEPYLVDIKSNENLNKFSSFIPLGEKVSDVMRYFPEAETVVSMLENRAGKLIAEAYDILARTGNHAKQDSVSVMNEI